MKSLKRATAVTLSAAMAAGLIAGPVTTTYAAETVEKEETVYVNQTATGDIKNITVSDWLKNVTGNGEIQDKSNLKDIKNVKGDEKFTKKNGNLTWKADNADIYYQGTTSEQPPIGVKISYKLDGKSINAKDLAGKSGNVEIKLQYTNDTGYEDEIGGETANLKSPFLMASAIILPVDNFSDINVSQGRLVSEGNNQILVAYGMPGLIDSLKLADDIREKLEDNLSDTVIITAKTTYFELGSIYTIATSDELTNVDLDENSDLDDLESAMDKLEDASETLVSGSSSLYKGIVTLNDNFTAYASGVSDLRTGASTLSNGAGQLSEGINQYTSGVKTFTDGTRDYVKGSGSLTAGIKSYVDGEKQIADGVKQLNDGSKNFPTQYNAFSAGLTQYLDGVSTVSEGSGQLRSGAAQLSEGVKQARAEIVSQLTDTTTTLTGLKDTLTTSLTAVGADAAAIGSAAGKLGAYINAEDNGLTPEQRVALGEILQELAPAATDEGEKLSSLQTALGSLQIPAIDQSGLDELVNGAETIASGTAELDTGLKALVAKNEELKQGSSAIGTGITTVTGGIEGLYSGINKLSANNKTLVNGAKTLEKNGTLLTNGIGQLTLGSATLTSSASQLSKGASDLSSGVESLDKATGAVGDGIGKLSDGSAKLSDGLNEFKTDGTDKLRNEYNENIKTVLDRFDSLTGKAGQYNTFSGLADGMDGTVKFIFKTAEIKNED